GARRHAWARPPARAFAYPTICLLDRASVRLLRRVGGLGGGGVLLRAGRALVGGRRRLLRRRGGRGLALAHVAPRVGGLGCRHPADRRAVLVLLDRIDRPLLLRCR